MLLNHLLATIGWLVVLVCPFVRAEYIPTIYMGSFGAGNGQIKQVKQYETYNITWGGANLSSVDVYLTQQTQKDVPASFDRARDSPLAANVTVSPFKWNVTQPVDTYWSLAFATNATIGASISSNNLQVVNTISTSAAIGRGSASAALILSAGFIAAVRGYF